MDRGCGNISDTNEVDPHKNGNEKGFDHEGPLKSCTATVNGEKVHEEPKVGMEFDSEYSAFDYYSRYAHRIGFSVRKQFVKRTPTGFVKKRTYCCSKQGERGFDKRRQNIHFHHPITRVGCKSHMTCLLQRNGKFKVVSFHAEHNHDFAPSPAKHMLRSKRKITFAQKALADDADKSGISIKSTVALMGKQAGGREHLGFMDVDYKNYLYTKRKMEMQKGDAGAVLEYFKKMKLEDPSFFYSIQLDDDDLITNIFWADSRSMIDYQHFGDVVCFDTTYRTNGYGRPFAPFRGVNHHKHTVIFAGALLYDETAESFKWLFETFLNAMSEKQPKTILTDQSAAMAKAIEEVFHETNHRLCVWHIYQNAAKHLSHIFHASKQFSRDLSYCVYDCEEEDEWLCAWNEMLEMYDLVDNSWLQSLFEEREKWAMVYGRHMFTADMKTTQRSESMNHVLKQYLDSRLNFLRFFEHYARLLKDRRYTELTAEFRMKQTTPILLANVEMLRHAVEVYTPEVFKMFQHEYMKVLDCTIHKVSKTEIVSVYKVICGGKQREHLVKFEARTSMVECSCKKFTFFGILCVHALKVLDKKGIKRIPPQYILKRWTIDAKDAIIHDYRGVEIQGSPQESIGKRYAYLSRDFREVTTLAAENEEMYAYAHKQLSKLLKDLEEMKKRCCYSTLDPDTYVQDDTVENVAKFSDGTESQRIGGIKSKATVGRPRNRFKDPLEKRKRQKSQNKTTQDTSNHGNGSQQKRRKTRQVNRPLNFPIQEHIRGENQAKHTNVVEGELLFDTFTQDPFWSMGSHEFPDANIAKSSCHSNHDSKKWPQGHMAVTELIQKSSTCYDTRQQQYQESEKSKD